MRTDDELVRILTLACDHLGMSAAFVSELTPTQQVYRAVVGDAGGFGLIVDGGPDRAGTYCDRMVRGELPRVIPDTAAEPGVRDLVITSDAAIGSYLGVPVTLSDGSVYGTFCCVSHTADPMLDERDAKFMALLGEMISVRVEAIRTAHAEYREVRQSLDACDVQIALQPLVSLSAREWRGAEALARFPSSSRRVDEMFAMAARCGLGPELELMCLSQALGLLDRIPPGVYLSVNMSPEGIATAEFVGLMSSCTSLDRLVLEVTEHAPVDLYGSLLDVLAPLRDEGLRLAVDDVGAGYASFRHVLKLHPDILKIDRSLVDGIASDSALRSIAGNLVLLALDLRATVVAEGVENLADLEVLETIGVDMAQGYLFARPAVEPATWTSWTSSFPRRPRKSASKSAGRATAAKGRSDLLDAATLAQACEAVVDELATAGYEMPSVYLLADGVLRCQAARGYFQVVDGFGLGTGVIGRIAATGRPRLIRDVSEHPEFIAAEPGVVSEAGVPVWVNERIAAVVNVESRTPLPPSTLGVLAAAAERLGAWMRDHGGVPPAQLSEKLARVCLELAALDDVDAVEQRALRAATDLSGLSTAVIARCSAGDGRWRVTASRGPLAETVGSWSPVDLGLLAERIGPGSSSHLPDGNHVTEGHGFLAEAGVNALMVLPLARGGRVAAALLVLDRRRPSSADPRVRDVLEQLAAQTAAALNAAAATASPRPRAPVTGSALADVRIRPRGGGRPRRV